MAYKGAIILPTGWIQVTPFDSRRKLAMVAESWMADVCIRINSGSLSSSSYTQNKTFSLLIRRVYCWRWKRSVEHGRHHGCWGCSMSVWMSTRMWFSLLMVDQLDDLNRALYCCWRCWMETSFMPLESKVFVGERRALPLKKRCIHARRLGPRPNHRSYHT